MSKQGEPADDGWVHLHVDRALLSATVTLFLFWSLGLLVKGVFAHGESPAALLRSGLLKKPVVARPRS